MTLRALLTAAAVALAALPVAADEFSAAEQAEIDARVRAYILENPEILVEAMQVLEQRQKANEVAEDQALIRQFADQIIDDGFSFVAGNPNGDVTVVEFSDYRCGYCKKAHDGVKALIAADDDVRLVIKEFPILGPDSVNAARAAMAAMRQGGDKYLAFNDAMMTWRGDLDAGAVDGLAAEAGLDVSRLKADMEDPEIAANIQKTYELARALKINGTPGFIIGGEIVRGYVPYDVLRELVENARESG